MKTSGLSALSKILKNPCEGQQTLIKSSISVELACELLQMATKSRVSSIGEYRSNQPSTKSMFHFEKKEIVCFAPKAVKDCDNLSAEWAALAKDAQHTFLFLELQAASKPPLASILANTKIETVILTEKVSTEEASEFAERCLGWSDKKLDSFFSLAGEMFSKGIPAADLVQILRLGQLVNTDKLKDAFLSVKQHSSDDELFFTLPNKLFRDNPLEFWKFWQRQQETLPLQFWTTFWIGFFCKSLVAKISLEKKEAIAPAVEKSLRSVLSLALWQKTKLETFAQAIKKTYVLDWKGKNGLNVLSEFQDIFISFI